MLNQISDHVWYLPKDGEKHRPALGYVCGGTKSMIVNTGNSPEHLSEFYGMGRMQNLPDPEFAAVTDWQWTHVFGMTATPAKTIAGNLTNDRLLTMQRWDWSDATLNSRVAAGLEIPAFAEAIKHEVPMRYSFKVRTADITYCHHMAVRLDDIHVDLVHVGGPHSEDCTVAYIPSDKVLFLGNCYCENVYVGGGAIRLEDMKQLLATLDSFDAETFIPSEDEPMSKSGFMKAMDVAVKVGELVGDAGDLQDGKERVVKGLGRPLDEREFYYVRSFVTGNRHTRSNNYPVMTEEQDNTAM